jgi:hypothetical protein
MRTIWRLSLRNSLLAKRDVHYIIITVDSEEWAISLENPDKNTIKCCQVCSINEGMRRASRSTVVVQNMTALKWLSPSYTIIYNYQYPPVV